MTDILIIGGGPAGLTAAIYGVRYGLSVTLFEQITYGGQVSTTPDVENYPGFSSISGFELSMKMKEQATELGVTCVMEEVTSLSMTEPIKVVNTEKGTYEGKTVIIANGAKRRKLNCPGEEDFFGKGVSYCATCDGAFFRGKDVAIIGGGNTALEEALFLSNHCNKVYLVHRRDTFRGISSLVNAVLTRDNIEILYDSTISSIQGEQVVSHFILENLKEKSSNEIKVSGVFIAIGTEPDNHLFADVLEVDTHGYLVATEDCKTNLAGVYVAGDSRTKKLRQIVTATADGAVAAFMATNEINHTLSSLG